MKKEFTITAVPNEETRTFDIIKVWSDGEKTIYRTGELSPEEFEEMEYNTLGDWKNFLSTDQSYYIVEE